MWNLQNPDGLIEDCFEVCDVIGAGERGPAEVGVQQEQGLGGSFLERFQLELHRKLLGKFAASKTKKISNIYMVKYLILLFCRTYYFLFIKIFCSQLSMLQQ